MQEQPIKIFVNPLWTQQQKDWYIPRNLSILSEIIISLRLLKPTAKSGVLCHLLEHGELPQVDLCRCYQSLTPSRQKDMTHFADTEDILYTREMRTVSRKNPRLGTKEIIVWKWVGPSVQEYLSWIPKERIPEAFRILEGRLIGQRIEREGRITRTWIEEPQTTWAGVSIEECLKLLQARE